MTTKTKIQKSLPSPSALPTTFRDLVGEFVPALIQDDVAHANAMEMADRLMNAGPLNAEQIQYGRLLGHLIQEYETTRWPRRKVPALEMLISLMEDHKLKGVDLAKLLGVTPALVSKILKGERSLTWEHAKVLGERFALKPEIFMKG